jgi:hypothetical protein
LFSRLKRRSSSFSVLVRPSFLSPASSSACLIQFLIVCSDGSNSFAKLRALLPARCSSTTWRRNSSGYSVRCLGIVNSSSTKSEVSTKPGQLHAKKLRLGNLVLPCVTTRSMQRLWRRRFRREHSETWFAAASSGFWKVQYRRVNALEFACAQPMRRVRIQLLHRT